MRKKKKQRKKKNVLNRILGFLLALVLLAAGAFLAYRFIEISDGDISIRLSTAGRTKAVTRSVRICAIR